MAPGTMQFQMPQGKPTGNFGKTVETLGKTFEARRDVARSGVKPSVFHSLGMTTYPEANAFLKNQARTAARASFRDSQKKRATNKPDEKPSLNLNKTQFAAHLNTLGLDENTTLTPTVLRTAYAKAAAAHEATLPKNATPGQRGAHTRKANRIHSASTDLHNEMKDKERQAKKDKEQQGE